MNDATATITGTCIGKVPSVGMIVLDKEGVHIAEPVKVWTQADFDAVVADLPPGDEPHDIHPNCHVGYPMFADYDKSELILTCAKCRTLTIVVKVATS